MLARQAALLGRRARHSRGPAWRASARALRSGASERGSASGPPMDMAAAVGVLAFAGAANGWILTSVSAGENEATDSSAGIRDKRSVKADAGRPLEGHMLVFAGSSNPELARGIADKLGVELGECDVESFTDGEVTIRVKNSVREADVYIVQSTCPPVNENLMELLLMVSAMRRAAAARITAVIPYYGYKRDVGVPTHGHSNVSRQSFQSNNHEDRSIPITAADVAIMLESMGVDRVVAVDLQPPGHGQIEGFFGTRVMVDNLETTGPATEWFGEWFRREQDELGTERRLVVVSPNEACVKKARDFQLGLAGTLYPDDPMATEERVTLAAIVHGGIGRGMDRYFHDPRSNVELVGDVSGADAILVDDMIDTGSTLASRVRMLRENGAKRIFAFSTHGLMSGPAAQLLARSSIEELLVTNTVPQVESQAATPKLKLLDVAPMLAEVISRLHAEQSIEEYRTFVGTDEPRYADQE